MRARRRGQVVRRQTANLLFVGSIPTGASRGAHRCGGALLLPMHRRNSGLPVVATLSSNPLRANSPRRSLNFSTRFGETPEAWKSIDVRTVAIRTGGVLENLYTLIRLSPKHLPEASEELATTSSLLARRQTFGIESLRAILEQVHAGTLTVAGEDINAIKAMESSRVELYGASSPTLGHPLRDLPVDVEFRVGHSLCKVDSTGTLFRS